MPPQPPLPSGKQACVHLLSFILPSGWHSVPTAPFWPSPIPGWAKDVWGNLGGGERSAPRPRTLGSPFLPRPDPKPSRPTAHPWKTIFPSTHRAQAEKRHPDSEEHPPRAWHSCSRLALADLHLSVAFPVCRPLTTGAIFVSQRCFLKPFKNGEWGGREEKKKDRKGPAPYLRGSLDTSGNLGVLSDVWPTRGV